MSIEHGSFQWSPCYGRRRIQPQWNLSPPQGFVPTLWVRGLSRVHVIRFGTRTGVKTLNVRHGLWKWVTTAWRAMLERGME
jgi:hypothetical protein